MPTPRDSKPNQEDTMGQIYEENEYGEMKPSQTSTVPTGIDGAPLTTGQVPRGVVYNENEYGEIDEGGKGSESNPFFKENSESRILASRTDSNGFGTDTQKRSEAFNSDEIYPENRFGEIGRADTIDQNLPSTTDRLKGLHGIISPHKPIN